MRRQFFAAAVFLAVVQTATFVACAGVSVLRTPHGGIQPQAAVDSKGTLHLIYYTGDPDGGDVFYVRRQVDQTKFSKPVRVNETPGSAIALGTIRGAQMALGKNERVHVAWDGMGKGASPVVIGGKLVKPLLYARLNDSGTGFEPERNLITSAAGLDGGSSVAADPAGNVYVTWHAPQPGKSHEDERERAVFVAVSQDEGKTFPPERLASSTVTGACACCGMRAFADTSGAAYILFRSATDGLNRDAVLLISRRPGTEFVMANKDPWKVSTCPMSSATITAAKDGAIAAWETAGQVCAATVDARTFEISKPLRPLGDTPRKHPVAVTNQKGETLLAWTEGTAWAKGGVMAYQVFNTDGSHSSERGRAEGLPVWSLPTACVSVRGDFLIFY